MPRGRKAPIVAISPRVLSILARLLQARKTQVGLHERVGFILAAAEGRNTVDIAAAAGVDEQRVRRWRSRWSAANERLSDAEDAGASDAELEAIVVELLDDAYRSGTQPTFSPEEVAEIIALACEQPEELGLPFSHWSARDLRDEVVKRGIVSSISVRQVGRFFKRCPAQASQSRVLAQPED